MKNNLGNKETMAINIRRYLKLRDKTMRQVSEAIDVPYNTVNDWANGTGISQGFDPPWVHHRRRFFRGRQALKNQRKTAFVHRCVKRVQKPFLSHKNKKIPGKKAGEG